MPFAIAPTEEVPGKLTPGQLLHFTATKDMKVGDVVVIAKGTPLNGTVVDPGDGKKLLIVKDKATFKLTSVDSTGGPKLAIRAMPGHRADTYQKLIAEALIELAERPGCQVLLTTHVPGLAGLLPAHQIRHIKRVDGHPAISDGSEDVYREIANELGVFSDHRIKVLVCIEGPHDVTCLKYLSHILHEAEATLPDLSVDPRIAFVPLGGSTLQQWVDQKYLKELQRPEVHLYDRGTDRPPKYQRSVDAINAAANGSYACLLGKRELENYLHRDAITEAIAAATPGFVMAAFTDDDSVPEISAREIHGIAGATPWDELEQGVQKKKISSAKRRLNDEAAPRMTYERLREVDANGDLATWLQEIGDRLR